MTSSFHIGFYFRSNFHKISNWFVNLSTPLLCGVNTQPPRTEHEYIVFYFWPVCICICQWTDALRLHVHPQNLRAFVLDSPEHVTCVHASPWCHRWQRRKVKRMNQHQSGQFGRVEFGVITSPHQPPCSARLALALIQNWFHNSRCTKCYQACICDQFTTIRPPKCGCTALHRPTSQYWETLWLTVGYTIYSSRRMFYRSPPTSRFCTLATTGFLVLPFSLSLFIAPGMAASHPRLQTKENTLSIRLIHKQTTSSG